MHTQGFASVGQQQRIAEIQAAIHQEQERLQGLPAPGLSRSFSSSSTSSTDGASSASSSSKKNNAGGAMEWTHVQEQMRMLNAWEARCAAEDAAVRQMENAVHRDMEASMGRKCLLMERLQHLCQEEALLTATETELKEKAASLQDAQENAAETRQSSQKQLDEATQHNTQRRQQLDQARRDLERRQAARVAQRESLKEDIARIDAHAAAMEAEARTVVQRIADHERRARLEESSMRESEASRMETLQRDIDRLLSHIDGGIN